MTRTSERVIAASATLLFMLDPGKHDGLTTFKPSVGRVIVLLSYAHSFRGGDCLRIGRLKSTVLTLRGDNVLSEYSSPFKPTAG